MDRLSSRSMAMSLALLSSPLLGPAVWAPVAQVLHDRGWSTITCASAGPVRTGQDVVDAFLSQLPIDEPFVLVPHSNSGAYVPALVMRRRVAATVFVDAVLPPRRGDVPLAPPEFLDFLRGKADDDGTLPVWTEWWDEADLTALFPDARTRTRVSEEQHRLPLSYFEETVAVPAGWDQIPGAYLAFGETYASERDDARSRGWPVQTVAAEHLHQLMQPDQVVIELIDLVRRLGIRSPNN